MDFLAAKKTLHQFLSSPPDGISQFISIENLIRFFLKFTRTKFATQERLLVMKMKKDKCLKSTTTLVAGVKRIGV